MRVVIQRVSRAGVSIDNIIRASILKGLLVLVGIEDSDPEVIRAAVAEMLARLSGNTSNSAEVSDLCNRADLIYKSHGVAGMGQLASNFLQRYEKLIV